MTLLMDNNLFVARRLKLFRNINSQPTLYEIITGKASRPIKINTHSKRKRADTVSHLAMYMLSSVSLLPILLHATWNCETDAFLPKATSNVIMHYRCWIAHMAQQAIDVYVKLHFPA